MNGVLTAAWIQGLCSAVPTTLAAAVAYKALSNWRGDALGRRRVLLAEDCLKQTWNLAWKIESLRRPLWAGAWIGRAEQRDPTSEELAGRDQCTKIISDQFTSFEQAIAEFKTTFRLLSYYRQYTSKVPWRYMDNSPSAIMTQDIFEEFSSIGVELKLAFAAAYVPDSVLGKFGASGNWGDNC